MGRGPNSDHKKAEKSLLDLMNLKQRIEVVLQRQNAEEIQNNKLRLQVSIEAARWLTFQNCPFRGHDESENSENRGNFIELIKFVASFDKRLEKVVLQNAPGNAQYISSTIQKEIMHIFASKVRADIRKEIGEAKFCVILDESQDISLREQMAIVLRFVDENGELKERFFDLIHVKNTVSLTLQQALYQVLSYHDLNVKNIRGQGYDGASNMRGKFNGLKALLLKDSPYAYYVHCFADRLQLALVAATREVIPIEQFFTKLAIIINLVDASPKRQDELQHAQQIEINDKIANGDEIETGRGLNQIGSLQRAGDTRWSSHLNSINSLLRLYNPTGEVLQTIINEGNRTQRSEDDVAYDTLKSFEFVFLLHLMKKLLGLSDNLCQALQRRTQDIVNAMSLVSTTKELIQNFRDNGWDDLLMEVSSFCEKNCVEIPDMTTIYTAGKGRSRRPINITLEHHYRVDLFTASVDSQLHEINKKCRLSCELQHFHLDVPRNPKLYKLSTLSQLSKALVDTGKATAYPLVDRLIRLVLTLPVSTATCERAFSTMSTVKTTLRNRMEDDFLSDILVVYIEKAIAKRFDLDSLIDDFASMKVRRVQFK
ncbi:hypothetical protein GQ457_03G013840 [Hibiscus cannabinus]